MRDPRLAAPGSDDLRHRRTLSDERNYAGTPPLIGTSASAFESYRTTMAQREAAARSARPGAPAHSAAAAAALLDGVRPHHWTSEHERMQRTFAQLRAQRHDLAQLPYPTPPPAAPVAQVPPPQPQPQPTAVPIHRVYIVRCATCDTFLSDRGMRAVLLLKPHIILFSTDSTPANSTTFWPDEIEQEQVERTCECLTSSINCHGCGKTVGYNIVSPCSKCNASVQKHQRSANHHRYVFHHNEVTARERTYYPGEEGVSNPIVRSQPALVPSRETSRPPAPLARIREADGADKDPAQLRSSRVRTVSPAPRARDRGLRLLKEGDTVYWHMLVPGGERCRSVDPRMRQPVWRENEGR